MYDVLSILIIRENGNDGTKQYSKKVISLKKTYDVLSIQRANRNGTKNTRNK